MDSVAKEKDATKTASGIVIRTITAGTGASPAADDVVKVHYEGKLIPPGATLSFEVELLDFHKP